VRARVPKSTEADEWRGVPADAVLVSDEVDDRRVEPTETGGVIGVGERKRDVKGRAGLLLDVAVAPPPSPARACLPSSQPMSKLSLPQIQPTIPKLIPPPPFCDSSKLIPSPRPVACM